MEVILLERVEKLGQMGDTVKVKDGFARNFLLPQKKALRATETNKAHFETQKAQLEAQNLERRKEAEGVGEKLAGQSFVVIRQAGESGQLYGSVASRDIATDVTTGGFTIDRNQVILDRPIKTIGLHDVRVVLHPEVTVSIQVNVARSDEEAERQARGEILTGDITEQEDEDTLSAEEVFETEDLAKAAEAELSEGDEDAEGEEAAAEEEKGDQTDD